MAIARLIPFVLALVLIPGAGAAARSFTDTVGDSRGAPDVVKVDVRNTTTNEIVMTVHVGNRAQWSGTLVMHIDTDGEEGGEYALTLNNDQQWTFERWIGSDWEFAPSDGIAASYDGRELEFRLRPEHIGGVTAFAFWVLATEGADSDEAPPAPESWRFELTPARVTGGTASFAPAAPRAGKTFALRGVSLQVDGVARERAQRFTCDALLGGKPLWPARKCAWRVPNTSRGKLLSVRVIVQTGPGTRLLLLKRFRVR